MTIIDRIRSLVSPPVKAPETVSQIVGGGNDGKSEYQRLGMDSPDKSHEENVKKWRRIYRRGGPAAACIDAYPLFSMSNGYEFMCDDGQESLKDKVIEWADQPHVNFEQVLWQGILDAVICGTAFQEIVPDQGQYGVWGVVPRDASSFRMIYDKYGRIVRYEQTVADNVVARAIPIPKESLLSISLFPVPGEMYGASLVERAYDDIQRDADMIESITVGVHRHGTAKNQVKCGQPGDTISTADMTDIKRDYEKVGPRNDWITGPDVDIRSVDSTLANLGEYSNITLQRLAAAFGIPDELLGLGRGSTEATATVRLKAFYATITTVQATVARTYSQEVLDRITGVPGSVWLEFSEVSTEDWYKKAQAISMLRTGMDPDAIADAAWCREQLDIPPDEDPLRQEPVELPADQTQLPFGQANETA